MRTAFRAAAAISVGLLGIASYVVHIALSFRIGVHWPVLVLWFVVPVFMGAFLVAFLGFVVVGLFRRWEWHRTQASSPRPRYDNWWGRQRFLRATIWFGTLAVKIVGFTMMPMLVASALVWDLVDIITIASTVDFQRRRKEAGDRWTLAAPRGRL